MKKIFTLIFLCVISCNAIHAEITWKLSDDGTLTISGTGYMEDYNPYNTYPTYSPWYSQRNKIKKVIIESGVTNIGSYAFYECQNLISVTIPNSVTIIDEGVFLRCENLTSLDMPNSITSIGKSAFFGSGLHSITIPNSVVVLYSQIFACCKNLVSVNLPISIETIPECMFSECSNLKSVIIPNSVKSIEKSAFMQCSALESINIPSSVTDIGELAFQFCYNLTSLDIPEGVISIGDEAFYGAWSIKSLKISSSLTTIGKDAFFGVSQNLSSIVVDKENGVFDSRNECNAIIKTTTNELVLGCENTKIPNTVTTIKENSFVMCSHGSITIPNSVKNIEKHAFYSCNIMELTINVNKDLSIASNAFGEFEKIIMHGEMLPKNVAEDFGGYSTAILSVPSALYDEYRKTSPWSKFAKIEKNDVEKYLTDGESYTNTILYDVKKYHILVFSITPLGRLYTFLSL